MSVVRRFIRRYAVYVVLASLAYLTWWSLTEADFSTLWHAKPEGGLTVWIGMDLVIAITVSWVPLIPDYTRFSRDRRSAFWGPGSATSSRATWMLLLGVFLVLTRGLSDPAQLPAAVVAAGPRRRARRARGHRRRDRRGVREHLLERGLAPEPRAARAAARARRARVGRRDGRGAGVRPARRYQDFLFLLGAFFVPLLGVLLAHWLLNGAHYSREDVFDAPAVRPALVAAWLVGFAVYQWLHPDGARAGGSTRSRRCGRRPAGSTRSASRSRASSRRSRSPRSRAS